MVHLKALCSRKCKEIGLKYIEQLFNRVIKNTGIVFALMSLGEQSK